MVIRKIVEIDEEKCNGCGLCIPACHEGAIKIINGKAKLIADHLCDGLGDCLGECPQGAIRIIEREAEEYDEEAVKAHLAGNSGCPGTRMQSFTNNETSEKVNIQSELRQWPVQLHLVPPNAPFFQEADLLLTASCVPIAYANYHQDLLKGKAVVIACPKLDHTGPYVEKLASIIKNNNLKSITIARMEVPCCGGLNVLVNKAQELTGTNIPVTEKIIGIRGNIIK